MKYIYKHILKPLLFLINPEFIHNLFIFKGRLIGRSRVAREIISMSMRYDSPILSQEVAGIKFKNPVGLAAGFDHNGKLTEVLSSVGFGFQSIGTVTYSPYKGNAKPRLVRLPKSQSILVNKGFKSDGIVKVLNRNIRDWESSFKVGISIGATNSESTSTPNTQIEDILKSFKYLKHHKLIQRFAYVEINISCPNVLGSGSLTVPGDLTKLLRGVREININKPIFVKFGLDIEWERARELIQIMISYSVDAIIISNLLKDRDAKGVDSIEREKIKNLKGNLSGRPTFDLSNELIQKVYKEFGKSIKIIGVGGIFSAQDAYEKIRSGASLIQLVTGMIYEGPHLIGDINRGIEELLKRDGYTSLQEAVGSGVKT